MLLKELMTTSEISYLEHNHKLSKICIALTKPVLERKEVSPLIEDNIEDSHDANHRVERGQSAHGGESSIVVDNHEDEKDENSGHKIHQHLQHQDYYIQRFQSFLFVFVAKNKQKLSKIVAQFKPDFYYRVDDSDEGEQY